MSFERDRRSSGPTGASATEAPTPGKRTLTSQLQRRAAPSGAGRTDGPGNPFAPNLPEMDTAQVRARAAAGVDGPGGRLPHAERIKESLGPHAPVIDEIHAHVGGAAADAADAIGAEAYATGNAVAFQSAPDIGLAAHEATHVLQQRAGVHLAGGVGAAGDPHEQQADAVAQAIERGEPAAHLLPAMPSRGTAGTVQRRETATPVASRVEPDAAVLAKTVDGFIEYTRRQADWSTHFTGPEQAQLQRLLHDLLAEPALSAGLGGFTVSAVLAAPAGDWVALRRYAAAIHDAPSVPTAKMAAAPTLARAVQIGAALPRLEAAVGSGAVLYHITSSASVSNLITAGRLEEFLLYCTLKQPQWLAPDDKEFDSFSKMRPFFFIRCAGLTDIRNLHHFDDAALDRLQRDKFGGHAGQPLAVILHNGIDHNGAFHHDANLTSAITGNPHRIAMIEGRTSLGAVEAEVQQVARDYGGGQINQIMFAGHGETRVIEQSGTTSPGVDGQGLPTVDGQGDDVDLDNNNAATMHLFNAILPLMGGADSRIVFNACLTASNDVTVDPANPDPPETQIANQLATRPSLVDTMRAMVAARGGTTTVLGGNASFPEGPTFLDGHGNFDINWSADPALTSIDRLDYVRRGIEPTGVLRAVLEHWQAPTVPPPPWLDAVNDRLTRPTASWDGAIITQALTRIQADPGNAQLVSDLSHAVATVSEAFFTDEARVGNLTRVPVALRPLLFGATEASTEWPGQDNAAAIPIYEVWARTDARKYGALITHLTAHAFTTTAAQPYLDWSFLNDTDLGQLLPAGARAAPTRGHLLIASASLKNGPASRVSRDFLIAVARANGNHFPAAPAIGDVADDSSEEEILQAIGLAGGGAAAAGGGPTIVEANVDANGDGMNERWIDRTAGFGEVVNCSVLRVHAGPGNAAAEVGTLHAGDRVFVQGTRDGWCSIDFNGQTGYVWRRFLTVT